VPFDDTLFLKQKVDILAFFSDDQLRRLTSIIERKNFNKGQTVMFQGEVSNNFHIIKRGKVVVLAKSGGNKAELAELKAGDFFGEMSLLESTAATATIKCSEDDTEILMVPHEAFHDLLKQNPLLETTLRDRILARKKARSESFGKTEGA
jgi:CRP-like cAMP-binding protein